MALGVKIWSNEEKEEKNGRKRPKDRDKSLENPKSKRTKLSKHWEIDPEAFHEIKIACKTLQDRKDKRRPTDDEVRKHLDAINQSATKLAALRKRTEKPSKEGTSSQDPNRTPKPGHKRKRRNPKVKTESDSDSAEPEGRPSKRSHRSTVSETEDPTDDEGSEVSGSEEEPEPAPQKDPGTMAQTESEIIKHRKLKLEIKAGKGKTGKGKARKGKDDKRLRLAQRSNDLFDHSGVNKEGNNYYRRLPPKDGGKRFKAPPKKPSDGAKLKNFPEGKMLKAAKITERQTAGKGLRPYLNGAGFQLRLAEAIRNLVALSLPEVKKTIRYKGKNGKPSRPVVDPRLMFALITMRREKRALDAFDQWNNRYLGPFPVYEDQSKIPYICLCAEDETENRKQHPLCWMGKELKNNKEDSDFEMSKT